MKCHFAGEKTRSSIIRDETRGGGGATVAAAALRRRRRRRKRRQAGVNALSLLNEALILVDEATGGKSVVFQPSVSQAAR